MRGDPFFFYLVGLGIQRKVDDAGAFRDALTAVLRVLNNLLRENILYAVSCVYLQ